MTARSKITVHTLRDMKRRGEKIVVLTAYDHPTARLEDEAGVEVILVGDSVGNVVLGYENTLPVTVDEMVHHLKAVSRARPRALLVGDLPFMSYQAAAEDAVRSAGRLVKEGGAEAVKVEGARRVEVPVRAIVDAAIPVMGHVGLTPQSVHQFGGYRVQGRDASDGERVIDDARFLEQCGCFSLVVEGVPWRLAERITAAVGIPTIGIGAGPHCDGQVLVVNDLLGIDPRFTPRFVKRYAEVGETMTRAFSAYAADVKAGRFPDLDHSYPSD
jgi:3-methyl-2-oxobutanoate hydroxymethyltransferase